MLELGFALYGNLGQPFQFELSSSITSLQHLNIPLRAVVNHVSPTGT